MGASVLSLLTALDAKLGLGKGGLQVDQTGMFQLTYCSGYGLIQEVMMEANRFYSRYCH